MAHKIFILGLLFVSILCYGQEHAWVYFTDKPDASLYLNDPSLMLSQKALDRRARQSIALDTKDVPISTQYIHSISNTAGIEVKAKSKWLNALHVLGSMEDIKSLTAFAFVDHISFANKSLNAATKYAKISRNKFELKTDYNYGSSLDQIEMLGGDELHQLDYTGGGMTIAVMDAGFPGVNTFTAFEKIRSNGQILGGYDYVNRSDNFYTGSSHGTSVLSIMAANVKDELIGSAPDANYYLFITEDASQETPLEESLWVEAAEKADSLGVDLINTSLGYYQFDNSNYDYSYEDMDGATTFITRGADIAFTRGMIVVNSAGNEGNDPWHYIIAPADGVNVLAIGAVDANEIITSFSSYGPAFDGRIKPDVNAKGGGTTIVNNLGTVTKGNGTSYSAPVMTGVIACLWQAFPDKTNLEIVENIKASSHLFTNPNDHEGFGLPDFMNVYTTFSLEDIADQKNGPLVFPNPFDSELYFRIDETSENIQLDLFDLLGKKLITKTYYEEQFSMNTDYLAKGIYVLKLRLQDETLSFKVIKK